MALEGARYCLLGVPVHITPRDLGEYFARYGAVVHVSLDRGTAYITMENDSAQEVIVTDKHNLGGKSLRACISKENLHSADVKKVHLGNLPEHTNPGQVREAFSRFGVVLDVHLPKDPRSGQRRNYGFVTFSSDEAFESSIATETVMVDGFPVTVKAASQTTGEGMSLQARKRAGVKYFVPGLSDMVTDDELFDHFKQFGGVVEAGVAVDKETGVSRGFGYVTMENSSSQEELLSGDHQIGGKSVQVLLTKESLARYGINKVHISNLSASTTAEEIKAACSIFGLVLDVHTPKTKDGRRQNYGFVTFSSADAFHAAVAAKRLAVGPDDAKIKPAAESGATEEEYIPPKRGAPEWEQEQFRNVARRAEDPYGFPPAQHGWEPAESHRRPMTMKERKEAGVRYFVPDLPLSVTDLELEDHFSKFGEVVDAGVVTEKETRQSRGFAYVTMLDASSQEALLTRKHMLGGRAITVTVTKESLAKQGYKVHLGELDNRISPDALKAAFSQFGLVVDVHTPKDPKTGERKNFGFVSFLSEDAFRAALDARSIIVESCRIKIKAAAETQERVENQQAAYEQPAPAEHYGKGPAPDAFRGYGKGPPEESQGYGGSSWGGKSQEDRDFWVWWIGKGKAVLEGKRGGKGPPRAVEEEYGYSSYRRAHEEEAYGAPHSRPYESYGRDRDGKGPSLEERWSEPARAGMPAHGRMSGGGKGKGKTVRAVPY